MSSPGAPANISTHPAVRKIEAKIQSLEKGKGDETRRLTEAEAHIVELEAHIKTLDAKLSLVMRSLKDFQRSAPMDASAMHFTSPNSPDMPTDGVVRLAPLESPVGVSATPSFAASPPKPASGHLSIPKIDALLSHLGIRLIEVEAEKCALEPMNAFGRENLEQLHGDYSLAAVENYILAHENMA